jgi:hypothetical protein
MHQVVELVDQALVRRIHGMNLCENSQKVWLESEWMSVVGYMSFFHILVRGLLASIFKVERDARMQGSSPFSIKKNGVLF